MRIHALQYMITSVKWAFPLQPFIGCFLGWSQAEILAMLKVNKYCVIIRLRNQEPSWELVGYANLSGSHARLPPVSSTEVRFESRLSTSGGGITKLKWRWMFPFSLHASICHSYQKDYVKWYINDTLGTYMLICTLAWKDEKKKQQVIIHW